MLRNIKNAYLKKIVKQRVNRYYIELGINPKELENMTMMELLKRVDYIIEHLQEYRDKYYESLDNVADLKCEIEKLNIEYKELYRKNTELEIENTKLNIHNDRLRASNTVLKNKDFTKEKHTVVSYERG